MDDFDLNKLKTIESRSFNTLSQANIPDLTKLSCVNSENIQTSEDQSNSNLQALKMPISKIEMAKSPLKRKEKSSSCQNSSRDEPYRFNKEFESNKKFIQIEPKHLDLTQELEQSIIGDIATPDSLDRIVNRQPSTNNLKQSESLLKRNDKNIWRTMIEIFLLLIVFLFHVIVIALITGFLSFYRFEHESLRYLDNIFDGLFLAIISLALNLDLISKHYQGDDKKKFIIRLGLPYFLIIACAIIICIFLDRAISTTNEYWIISIQILALLAASMIYIICAIFLKKRYQRENKEISMTEMFLKIKNLILTQFMIIYPFIQLMISVSYARAFHKISELKISDWALFGICMTYPISIGISKFIMEKTAKKSELKMKFYIEYISIAFAALPFRTLYFDISEYDRLIIILFTKFFYKSFYYILVALKVSDIKKFIERMFKKSNQKVGKRGTKILAQIADQVIDLNPSSQIDIDIKQLDPTAAEFGLKFILLMFSDIFSTITMIIIVSLFNKLRNGLFGEQSAIDYYVQSSAIDLGLDIIFLFIVTCLWKFSKTGLRTINLFEVGKMFFKRYYLVFLASNFNLFHTLFYVLSSLLTLS